MGNVVDSLFSFSCLERTPYHLLESCFLALFFCSPHTTFPYPFLSLSRSLTSSSAVNSCSWGPILILIRTLFLQLESGICAKFSGKARQNSESYKYLEHERFIFGKVAVVKTFLIPKLLYVSSIIQTPMEIIKRMERMIFNFFYGKDQTRSHEILL